MVRVVHRVFSVLECFDEHKPILSLHEVALRIGLPKTTVFRLLVTLVDAGYVIQTPAQKYYLSHKLMRLASVAQKTFDIRDIVRPIMMSIGEETGETLDLHMITGRVRVCIDVVESPHPLKNVINPGQIAPLARGASGKVLLAYGGRNLFEDVLSTFDPDDRARLVTEIAEVRRNGYAYTRGERVPGASAISVPLQDHLGEVRYCLTLSGPSFRCDPRLDEFVPLMLERAHEISSLLGAVANDADGAASRSVRFLEP